MADGMRVIEQMASRIASAVITGEPPAVKGDPAEIAAAVKRAIVTNLSEEATINKEAERLLDAMPEANRPGMDKDKLLAGLRERIAKKRGFVL